MNKKFDKVKMYKHTFDNIGTVYFYKNFLITEFKDGVTLNIETVKPMLILGLEYYNNTIPFVYISNRVNSYSFEPTVHFKITSFFPNLKGYGVITYNEISNKIAQLESKFIETPFKIFHDVDEAMTWAQSLALQNTN